MTADGRSTKDLFRAWRSGDADAGQEMAQRFADWYYAIATSRLGEDRGRDPCQRACDRFAQGIVEVTESRALVDWAYGIIEEEVKGDRAEDGDEANAYTANKKPKSLLRQAREALPDEVALLEGVYSGKASEEEVAEKARPLGGMPIGVLKARYRVKQWLRDQGGVPFEVAPDDPVLDRAPLPLYESGHMQSDKEEANFEKWMLTDLDLCRDIAEFAHFAIALRGGLGAGQAPAGRSVVPEAAPPAPPPTGGSPAGKAALGGVAIVGIGIVVLLLLALVAVLAYYFLM